jgi:tRNA G18 (ribose-2'-O)-methylase SpoU
VPIFNHNITLAILFFVLSAPFAFFAVNIIMRKLQNSELDRLSPEQFRANDKTPIVIVLDNVRSHLNVGSVFRTADAFLIEAIYLCGITGTPPHRDIQKTALGATETVAWRHFETTAAAIGELKSKGYKIASVEQAENATMLNELNYDGQEKLAVVFGNEVEGVEQAVVSASDMVIEIPQWGTKHSLNISVSAGIVIWEMVRQLKR